MMDMQLAEAVAMMQQHPELNTIENRNTLQQLGRRIAGGGAPPGLQVRTEDGTPYTLTIAPGGHWQGRVVNVVLTGKGGEAT